MRTELNPAEAYLKKDSSAPVINSLLERIASRRQSKGVRA